MSRPLIKDLSILVFLVSITSECYAWCIPPDVVIWDWRKYPCKGQSVGIRADSGDGEPIYDWDWDFPSGLSYSYGYESEYQSNVTVWSSSPGTYYVYAWGYNYCEWDYDWAVVYVVEVASVTPSETWPCVGEAVTFTANSNPSSKPLTCIEWQRRYRPNSSSSWGSWGSASGGDNTAILSTTTAGLYQYRARNGSADPWKESSEVIVVEVASVASDKNEACDGEDVRFEVTTNPPGYGSIVS